MSDNEDDPIGAFIDWTGTLDPDTEEPLPAWVSTIYTQA